jgi:regulator of sigma E protease
VAAVFWFVVMLTAIVVVHEGGHAVAARLAGARVTEFFVGLPAGPQVSWTSRRTGITYGATLALLGGYTRIAGMAPAEDERLPAVLALANARGRVTADEVAQAFSCERCEAAALLAQLADWGSLVPVWEKGRPKSRAEVPAAWQTPARDGRGRTVHDRGYDPELPGSCAPGDPYVPDVSADELYQRELGRTYQGLSCARRLVVLVAGVACNVVFALVVLAAYAMVCGFYTDDGTLVQLGFVDAFRFAWAYTVDVACSVAQLLVPTQAAAVLDDSSGVVGVAVVTYEAVQLGAGPVLLLAAMLSMSLGWMNLLPIPPLDGGRVLIELVQLVIRRPVPVRVQNALSLVGMALFMMLFVYMVMQDATRLGAGLL